MILNHSLSRYYKTCPKCRGLMSKGRWKHADGSTGRVRQCRECYIEELYGVRRTDLFQFNNFIASGILDENEFQEYEVCIQEFDNVQ